MQLNFAEEHGSLPLVRPVRLRRACKRERWQLAQELFLSRWTGVVTPRVLFDGTNGISVSKRTLLRDHERTPIAADLKRAIREKAQGGTSFALTADVSEAHWQMPIAKRDWHLLGCQVNPSGHVYVNTVSTFGVASASYS